MRALSVKQPWLHAITDLGKRVENRTWPPPESILGKRIALHASKTYDREAKPVIEKITGAPLAGAFAHGSIVATAIVAGWVAYDYEAEGEVICSDPRFKPYVDDRWFFGPFGWILDDVQKLDRPVPCRGMLGLWRVPGDILKQIQLQEETT